MNKDYLFGAGLSRLLTAFNLQNKGLYIEIIEARNRIGGEFILVILIPLSESAT
jgi:monoamine oxidase